MDHPWRYEHEHSRLRHAPNPMHAAILARMVAAGALWVKGTRDAQTFTDGDVLDVPGRPRVVFCPGHTHGHCALHLPERGAVLAGDAVVMLDPYTGREGPQIVSGAATADSARAFASLDALAATGAETVLTGHGAVWRHGAREIAARAKAAGAS